MIKQIKEERDLMDDFYVFIGNDKKVQSTLRGLQKASE